MLLKVGRHSGPQRVADLILALIAGGETVEIRTVGADALNRAVKAVVIAREHIRSKAIDLFFRPSFVDVDVEGRSWTALHLHVERHVRTREEGS